MASLRLDLNLEQTEIFPDIEFLKLMITRYCGKKGVD